MSLAVVLHDLGDPQGGRAWRDAAPGPAWEAPDLPGHGATPSPRSGAYDPSGPWTLARWRIEQHGLGGSLVVGVGQNALGAAILGVGGACSAIALVDGLAGPWLEDADERVEVGYRHVRAILGAPEAYGAPPARGLDPRTAVGYALVLTPRLCRPFWRAIEVPTLLVETPASATPPDEVDERASWFGGPTELVRLDAADPGTVLATVDRWWSGQGR